MPDNYEYDICATMTPTPRAERIDEIIKDIITN